MKSILLFWLFWWGLSVNIPQAFPQEVLSQGALTLEECIDVALKRRPELDVATLDVLNSEYQVKEATSYYYPRLNFSTGYTRFMGPENFTANVDITQVTAPLNEFLPSAGIPITLPLTLEQEFQAGKTNWFNVTFDLNQPVYTFGRIEEGIKQARIGRSIAFNQKEKKKEEIIFEVKRGYYQLLFSKKLLDLTREAEAGADVVVRMVKIDYETSIPEKEEKGTTRLDYLKARNFLAEVKVRLSEAGKNVKLAELGLKMAIGMDPSLPLKVTEVPLESLPHDRNSGEMKEWTLERNLDIKNLRLGVELFDSKRKSASKEYLPKIGIQGQYIGPEDRFGTPNFWYAGIGITMPIFDGFSTRAKVGQAEVQFNKAKAQKSLLESALVVQIDRLNTDLTEFRERVGIFKMAVMEAQERAQLAADGYAVGSTEYDELLLAQRSELEVKSGYLQSLYHYYRTKAELEFVSGAPR